MSHSGSYPHSPGAVQRDGLRPRSKSTSLSPVKKRVPVNTAPTQPHLFSQATSPERYDKLQGRPSQHESGTLLLPKISAGQRPTTSMEITSPVRRSGSRHGGEQGSRRSKSRQSWPGFGQDANRRPPWVDSTSANWSDEFRDDARFRAITSREGSSLVQRLATFTAEREKLMTRQSSGTPLVVCVLDEFASSGGLLNTIAGQDVAFAIQVKYSFAGSLGEGGSDLHKWVDDKGGFSCILTGPVVVRAEVVYQGAGTYVFMYKATVSGKYMVSVQLGRGDIPGSPFQSVVEAGEIDVDACTVHGLGLLCAEAGHEAQFQITARDRFGNRKTKGGDAWDVSLTGPVAFNAIVHDMDNGVYICKYTSVMCGDFYVSVRNNSRLLPGCPFVLSVVAGRTHGPSCSAVGSGLSTAYAGQDTEFIIEARDIIGNLRVIGDDQFNVEVEGPSLPQVSVYDRDDGTYLVTYNVQKTGEYHVRVSLDGFQILGSPFTVNFLPGTVIAVRCTAVGRGITRAYAGEDAKFTIESRDAHANKTISGTKPFRCSIRGAIAPQVHCIQGDNGEYHYAYRTAKAGVYFASVLLDGVDIGGSPFKLTIDPGPAHANGCSAFGPGVDGGYVGVETSFTIQSRDYFGNTRTSGGDIFNVEIGGTASAEMRMRDNENGTYTVAFTPMVGGDYFINVTIQGTHIQGSPFTVTADPMPRESYLEVYRSVEPNFKKTIEKQLMGGQPENTSRTSKAKKLGGNTSWRLNIKLLSGRDLAARDTTATGDYGTGFVQTSDPYVVFKIGKGQVRSSTVSKNLNPEWNQELELAVHDRMQRLEVEVMDEDAEGDDDSMGTASVSIVDLVEDKAKMVTCALRELDAGGQDKGTGHGELVFVLTFKRSAGNISTAAMR